jgi:hypothetical protein
VTDLRTRADVVVITDWDPDDPAQRDGPPGLPLRAIAAAGPDGERGAPDADLIALATAARAGDFYASLTLVTVVARR